MFYKQVIIRVDGMKCVHCAKKVQEELKKIDNIKSVKVNLDDKKGNPNVIPFLFSYE